MTGPELLSRLIAVVDDCRRRFVNLLALFDSLLIKPGDLLSCTASLIALWLDFRETIDSGSSKGGGGNSCSRPRGPSGEPCIDELFVVTCVVSGDMLGEACSELEVATDEALIAEAGTDGAEVMGGRKEVCT